MKVRNAIWEAEEKDGVVTLRRPGGETVLDEVPAADFKALKAVIEQMERGA